MLGTTGKSAYEADLFPEFVWQSQWNPFETNLPPIATKLEAEFESVDAEKVDMEHP